MTIKNIEARHDVIVNPVSGQTVTFVSETRAVLRTRFDVEAGHAADPRHVHPHQVETITVLEGQIRCSLPDRSEHVLGAGQSWAIQPGTPHTWTAIDSRVSLDIDFRPALRTRRFMTRLFGLAEAGKTNSKGMPNPLQVSVIGLEYAPEFRLAAVPWRIQRALLAGLAPVARMFGFRA